MPPKKPKKTKAELEEERIAREEEERKAREKEEKRIAEENELRRLEEIRIKAEQKEFRQKELERFHVEYESIIEEEKERENQQIAEQKLDDSKLDWLRYKNPSEEPDASLDKDMNTFISLMRDVDVLEMSDAIGLMKRMEKVARAVEDVWSDSLAVKDTESQAQAHRNLDALKEIMYDKLDAATVHVLKFVEKHLNDRTEINIEEVASKLSIGIWSSMSEMRPTRKSVQLEKMGVQVDIPKQILQQHEKYVFRVIRMPIDTYNLNAYRSQDESGIIPRESELHAATKYVVGDLITFDILHSMPAAYQLRARRWTMRDNSSTSSTIRKASYPSSVPCRMIVRVPDDVVISDDFRIAIWNEDVKDWTEDGITEFQYSEATRSVQFYVTTVGTMALVKNRTVDLPYKRWNLAPVYDKKVNGLIVNRLIEAESEASAAIAAATAAAAEAEAAAAAEAASKAEEAAAEGAEGGDTGEVPADDSAKDGKVAAATTADDAHTSEKKKEYEDAAVEESKDLGADGTAAAEGAAVKAEENAAETAKDPEILPDGETNVDVDGASEAEEVKVTGYGDLGEIISRKTGELERHARFFIRTQKHELVIDIIGSECMLVQPDSDNFSDLIGVEMKPGTLLYRLLRKGINLLPTAADLSAADCSPKNPEMEQNVLNQLARGASSLEFGSASWNQTLNSSQIGILAKESTVYSSFMESFEYECILAELDEVCKSYIDAPELGPSPGPGGLKYTLVFGNEYGTKKNFSHMPRPDEIPHLELSTVLGKRITQECLQRFKRINTRFQKTLLTFLSMIKPYSLC